MNEFRRATGGGPANVAVGAARLGAKVSFIGKVGADAFGDHLGLVLRGNSRLKIDLNVDVYWS